jgi:hypothetical protein
VELKGLEPLTPTLPDRGTSSEQGVEKARGPVADAARHVPVVTVVVKTVVGTPAGMVGHVLPQPGGAGTHLGTR